MNYIVTGAGGYVGFAVVKELLSRGLTPRCLEHSGKTDVKLTELGADVYHGDITDLDSLQEIFDVEGDICVIHCAALISVGDKLTEKLYRINVDGTRNMIAKCQEKDAALVYIGSIESAVPENGVMAVPVYDPDKVEGGYAKSKAMAASLVLAAAAAGLQACILLPCAVFGPYDYRKGPASTYLPLFLRHRSLPFIHGGYEISDNRDIAYAAVEACVRGRSGASYILSSKRIEMVDFLNIMRKERNIPPIPWLIPTGLLRAGAAVTERIMRMIGKEPMFTAFTIDCINRVNRYSNELAVKDLGYSPHSIEDTAHSMVRFYEEMGWI